MTDRQRNLLMVFSLAHQLTQWMRFMVDLNNATREFKYDSKLLADHCDRYIRRYMAQDQEIYEHSIQISDLVEAIAKMDQAEVDMVIEVINRINKNK